MNNPVFKMSKVTFIGFLSVMSLVSCREVAPLAPTNSGAQANVSFSSALETADLKASPNFKFNSFSDQYIAFQIEDGSSSPYEGVFAEFLDTDTNFIRSGVSDASGLMNVPLLLPSSTSKVGVVFLAIGIPQDTFWYDLNVTHSINLPDFVGPGLLPKRMAKIIAMNQTPQNQVTDLDVSAGILSEVNKSLPEKRPVPNHNPEYIQQGADNELKITDSAEVWVTFIHEGAGYKNSMGYFSYPTGSLPASSDSLDKTIIFPNTSYQGSGGILSSGDRVLLGSFSQGQTLGFYIIANGWTGQGVNDSKPTYYSISDFNPEATEDKRKHLVLLHSPTYNHLILGFEDLNRHGGDNDFNDAVFVVEVSPITSLKLDDVIEVPVNSDSDGDGVADNNDDFPNDPERATKVYYPSKESWGTLAYEDYFPNNGDYDFNDVVVSYQIWEALDGEGKVKEIEAKFIADATGAEFRNGFAIYFPALANKVESKAIERVVQKSDQGWTTVSNGLIAHIFPDLHYGFDGQGFINTQEGSEIQKGDTSVMSLVFTSSQKIDIAPYNAFIYRKNDPSLEIHLADFSPTPLFDNNYFNTGDDNSNISAGKTFRNYNNLPWALNTEPNWKHPKEHVDILVAYPNFGDWVTSSGKTSRDWVSRGRVFSKVWQP
ncbi:LruC domain-containing protein [Fibrobacterales bacterium]|nr:LruC domain-containing protein [Fibrobacterales bacterium]